MVARLLHDCGLDLGDEADLAAPKPDNPDGFWENQKFVDLNEEIFAHLGGGWDLPPELPLDWDTDDEFQKLRVKAQLLVGSFRGREPWGWKDPRNSVTIPFWKSVLPNLKVIVCVRHPLAVAVSLRNRNFLSYELSLTLWTIYNRRVLEDVAPHQRLLVNYDAFFQRPDVELRRLLQFSGLPSNKERTENVLQRIRGDFRHVSFDTRHLIDANLAPETIRLYLALAAESGWLDGARDLPGRYGLERPEARLLRERNDGPTAIAQHGASSFGAGKLNRNAFELELLRRQIDEARPELVRREARIHELEEQLVVSGRNLAAADAAHANALQLEAAITAHKAELASLQSINASQTAEIEQIKEVLASEENALAASENETTELSAALEQMAQRVAAAERERDAVHATEEAARQETMSLSKELTSIHTSRLWKVGSMYWRVLEKFGRLRDPHAPEAPAPPASSGETSSRPSSGDEISKNPKKEVSLSDNVQALRKLVRQKLRSEKQPDARLVDELQKFVDDHERRFSRPPTILDWNSGPELAAAMPRDVVFSPAVVSPILPYLAKTVDVVFVPAAQPQARDEASRVARHAVVTVAGGKEFRLQVEWLQSTERTPLCASIIIPVFNQLAKTEACLAALDQTLPEDFCGEIIVVDDASTDETASRLALRSRTDPRLRVITNPNNMGFIDSCNRGAKEARHSYLIFLNNDTVPQQRWLSSLLQTFARYPNAGAAGGKLLYPDGRLQEAGGCIFSDASGLNFGKFDPDPAAPLYSFVREVDYCSGALLATPRAVFDEIGGFDERYRPAYYEDADYCLEVRKRGMNVLYQPESTVVHIEGATSGTDLRSGAKRHQVTNQEKFREKWKETLALHPSAPSTITRELLYRLAPLGNPRRVLFINHTVPEYDREGGSRRLFHLIEFLREAKWAVSFMAPWVPWGERYERELQQMGVQTYRKGLFKLDRADGFDTEAERLIALGAFDVAVISFWHIAETWTPQIRKLSPRTRVVIDAIDLHFLRQSRAALRQQGGAAAQLSDRFADEMRRELNSYAAADAVITVSEKEAEIINDFASNPRLAFAVPETEPPFEDVLPFEQRKGVLFIGSFRHPPNFEAVTFLAKEILPLVSPDLLDEHPVYIVGNGLDEKVREVCANVRNVRLVGWVPSLDDYLRCARVSVLPLLNGAGTKTKLIQALNAGTPSVSTRIGAEGLPIRHDEHVWIADDPAEFAAGIERLLTDRALWLRLAEAGRRKIQQTHGRSVGIARLLGVLDDVIASSSSH